MTIVVFKDGCMAADMATFRGDIRTSTTAKKIVRTPQGALVGCAGDVGLCDTFRAWALKGFPETDKPDPFDKEYRDNFGAIVAFPDGRIVEYYHDMIAVDCTDEQFAVEGSGGEFCRALNTLGWTAEAIVAHAIKHCVWAGGDVYALRLDAQESIVGEAVEPDDEPIAIVLEPQEPEQRYEQRGWLNERGLGGQV